MFTSALGGCAPQQATVLDFPPSGSVTSGGSSPESGQYFASFEWYCVKKYDAARTASFEKLLNCLNFEKFGYIFNF